MKTSRSPIAAPSRVTAPDTRRASGGFTLIELMITVAILGILAAIALPSYQEYVRKGRRADVQSFMLDVVARQQHFLLDRRTYAVSITDPPADNGLGVTIPTNVSSFYTITIETSNVASPPTFVVTGTPAGSQTGEKCGVLTIDQRGVKGNEGTGTCW